MARPVTSVEEDRRFLETLRAWKASLEARLHHINALVVLYEADLPPEPPPEPQDTAPEREPLADQRVFHVPEYHWETLMERLNAPGKPRRAIVAADAPLPEFRGDAPRFDIDGSFKDPTPEDRHDWPPPEPVAEPVVVPVAPPLASRLPAGGRHDPSLIERSGVWLTPSNALRWTVERIAMLRERYPDRRWAPAVLRRDLNALPGTPIGEKDLWNFIAKLKLKRSQTEPILPPQVAPVILIEPSPDATPESNADLVRRAAEAGYAAVIDKPSGLGGPLVDTTEFRGETRLNTVERPKPAVTIIAPAPPPVKVKPPPPVTKPNLGPPRLAKALELPTAPTVSNEPIEADLGTVRALAGLWGVAFRDQYDLPAVNIEARKRGARPFTLVAEAEKKSPRSEKKAGPAGRSWPR